MTDSPRPLMWIGRSKKDYLEFPPAVQERAGYALFRVQVGASVVPHAKPIAGGLLHGLGIMEIAVDYDKDTYRTVYLARFTEVVYVLHAFKKKSRHGIATPQQEIELIRARYDAAVRAHQSEFGKR